MTEGRYKALSLVGLEVKDSTVELSDSDKTLGKASFKDIIKVGLIKTDQNDSSGFLAVFLDFITQGKMFTPTSRAPSPIYILYVATNDGLSFEKKIQDFNVIGVSGEVKRLTEEAKKTQI